MNDWSNYWFGYVTGIFFISGSLPFLLFCHISSLVEIYMIVVDFSFCPLMGAWELADFTVVVTVTSFFCTF